MSARLAAISIYPVKSCRGIALERAIVERRGIADDRRCMFVDERGTFVTQRGEPRLALIDVALRGARLARGAPGMPTLELEVGLDEGTPIEVSVWGDVVAARAHGAASAWISRYLGRALRMVSMPESTRRAVSPQHAAPGDVVSFADGFPLLLASRASLEDLNARLGAPIGMERFRPNVVVAGAPAWAEDGWTAVRIGPISFRAPKPCERCIVTTIDPRTGVAGREPLRTLATFRKTTRGVLFGVNLIPDLPDDARAEIAIGDPVVPIA